MSQHCFIYSPAKIRTFSTFVFPTGKLATPEVLEKEYPSILVVPHLIVYAGRTIFAIQEFGAMRNHYGVPDSYGEVEALEFIEQKLNTEQEIVTITEPSPEEIQAGAAVLSALTLLDDNPQD